MAQDVVGRRDVKEKLRDAERQQQRFSGELALRAVLESEGDFLVGWASISARGKPCTKSIAADIRDLSSGMSGSVSEDV